VLRTKKKREMIEKKKRRLPRRDESFAFFDESEEGKKEK